MAQLVLGFTRLDKAPVRPAEAPAPPPSGARTPTPEIAASDACQVGCLPAFDLGGLPLLPCLTVEHPSGITSCLAFHKPRYALLRARKVIVWSLDEWLALVLGAEADRATAQQFGKYLESKRKTPSKLLEPHHTLGGVAPSTDRRRWATQRVLVAWGLTLTDVWLPEPTPVH